MLVLGRKEGESIRIADCIEIKILGVNGNRVQLGVEAPRTVRILRGEVDRELGRHRAASTREGRARERRSVA